MKQIMTAANLATVAAVAILMGGQHAASAADPAPVRSPKDVVLAPLAQPVGNSYAAQPAVATQDGMAVSVLLETPQGVLVPGSAQRVLENGQRFRLKILTAREGDVDIYNTNPLGQTNPEPVWSGPVHAGLETLTPSLMLTGNRGEDQLHVVLRPQTVAQQGAFTWFNNMFASKNAKAHKDIRLVTENTPQATYVYNAAGQGGYVTVHIVHQ